METGHLHPPCHDCRFYQPQEQGIGACHRFPPQFGGDGAAIEFHRWKFPLVSGHSWCGEHRELSGGQPAGAAGAQ